jgi:hypothetical protein
MRSLLAASLALALVGPALAEPESEPAPPPRLMRAKKAVKQLVKTLKGRLGEAMRKGGPSEGVKACQLVAQDLTAATSNDTGVRVGRSSLRLRNPKNRGPEWVQELLEEWGEGRAANFQPGHAEVDGTLRFWKPIPVEGVCLNCHAKPDALVPEVREALAEAYPEDRATGFAFGDLRGVIWAEIAPEPEAP